MTDDEDTFCPELMSTDKLRVTEAAMHQVLHRSTYHRHVVPKSNFRRFERSRFDLSFLDAEAPPERPQQ